MVLPTIHLWILGAMLVGLAALYFAGMLAVHEGFSSMLRCPTPEYTFFNDSAGASFCCRGRVNPYTHQCGAIAEDDLCAFVPNTADPRNPKRMLRLCAELGKELIEEGANYKCPNSLPKYAIGSGKSFCCATAANDAGTQCVASDMSDKSRYCVADGSPSKGEQSCTGLIMTESAKCPEGQNFQKVNYTLGDREGAAGLVIPTCYRVTDACIPDEALTYAQEAGAFKGREPATWGWSCSTWERRNVAGDQTGTVVRAYP